MRFAILDRNPKIADDKMEIKRAWLPSNPSAYKTDRLVYSLEASSFHWIKKHHRDIEIDLLQFEKIVDKQVMDKYTKIFIFNHGLSDEKPFWKQDAERYKKAWKKLGDRIWPSYRLANFIMDKCQYYKHVASNGIVTADTKYVNFTSTTPVAAQFKQLPQF